MGPRNVQRAATNVSVVIRILDSSDGTPEQAVTASSSPVFWYRREGGTLQTFADSDLSALDDAHSDGGFLHIDDGYYRVDVPDAAFATGATGVQIGGNVSGMVVYGPYIEIESAVSKVIRLYNEAVYGTWADISTTTGNTTSRINLTDVLDAQVADGDLVGSEWDVWDATNDQWVRVIVTSVQSARLFNVAVLADGSVMDFTVASGDRVWFVGFAKVDISRVSGTAVTWSTTRGLAGTALPNAAADAAGGLPISDAGGLDLDTQLGLLTTGDIGGIDVSELNAIVDDLINGGRLDLLIDAIKAKTDSLTFTQSGHVDSNVQRINDVAITGDGSGTPFDV